MLCRIYTVIRNNIEMVGRSEAIRQIQTICVIVAKPYGVRIAVANVWAAILFVVVNRKDRI